MVDVSCIVSHCDGAVCVGMDGDDVRSMLCVLHRRIAVSCWLKVASIWGLVVSLVVVACSNSLYHSCCFSASCVLVRGMCWVLRPIGNSILVIIAS